VAKAGEKDDPEPFFWVETAKGLPIGKEKTEKPHPRTSMPLTLGCGTPVDGCPARSSRLKGFSRNLFRKESRKKGLEKRNRRNRVNSIHLRKNSSPIAQEPGGAGRK